MLYSATAVFNWKRVTLVIAMPLVVLLGAFLVLMLRKGGWKTSQVFMGGLFGLALAATTVGPELTGMLNQFSEAAVAAVSNAFGGLQ